MSQPEISPLARRLAEENNVDWRGLHGSGAGGKVVERDVLEFLARVMAGEEDVDPTPEPVPEGMEAWPDEDVRSFHQEVQASRKDAGLDEIQQELSAADRLRGDGAQESLAPESPEVSAAPAEADDISEDIFLFGDDSEEDDVGAVSRRQDEAQERPEAYGASAATQEDDLLVAGEDDLEIGATEDADLAEGGFGDAGDDMTDRPAASDEALFEPGGDRADAERGQGAETAGPRGTADGLPDVFGDTSWDEQETWDAGSDRSLFAREAGAAAGASAGRAEDELEVPSLGDVDAGDAGAAEQPAPESEQAWDVGPEEGATDAGVDAPRYEPDAGWDVGAGAAGRPEGERWASASEEQAMPPAAEVGGADVYTSETYASEGYGSHADASRVGASQAGARETDAFQADAYETGAYETGAYETRGHGSDETGPVDGGAAALAEEPLAGESTGAEAPPAPSELPLVSYGALLRRHLDVTALAGAQLAIGLELGEGEPLSPAPFLLRAAAKAVAEGGWGDGTVAMVALASGGGVRLRPIDDAARRPFLELVRALADEGTAEAGTAALSVVDMSALDVDEAVLNVGGPQLTLGRILYDNQRGSYRSTLSLAGEVPPERGARLLARVAELLDAPVRLVL